MAHDKLMFAARMFVAALGFAVASAALAQSPAVSPKEAEEAKQQAAQQLVQPLNNQPLWSEVRTGQPQYTSIPGRETNVLVQPQGQTWRAVRVPLATVGGFLFALTLLAIAVFYVLRGPIKTHGAPTGRMIERFTLVERAVHWSVAITFVALGITGLILTFGKNVLLPLIGYTLFSWLAILAKNLHNFVGPLLVILLPIMIVMFVRENLFRAGDWAWLEEAAAACCRARTCRPARPTPGQKVLFWLMVVGAGITLCVTGLILDFPNFNQTRQTMQVANVVHMIAGARRHHPGCSATSISARSACVARSMRCAPATSTKRGPGNITNTGTTKSSRGSFPTQTCRAPRGNSRRDAGHRSNDMNQKQMGGGSATMKTIRAILAATFVVASFGVAVAKLPPAAPLTDAQKAEAKAKADAAADLAKQQQAKAEDRVAAQYFANMKAQGKVVPPPQMAAAPAAPAARESGGAR